MILVVKVSIELQRVSLSAQDGVCQSKIRIVTSFILSLYCIQIYANRKKKTQINNSQITFQLTTIYPNCRKMLFEEKFQKQLFELVHLSTSCNIYNSWESWESIVSPFSVLARSTAPYRGLSGVGKAKSFFERL